MATVIRAGGGTKISQIVMTGAINREPGDTVTEQLAWMPLRIIETEEV
jgi:hypothetical protein